MFAGPNGSGKTTLAEAVEKKSIPLGVFVNADNIEKELRGKGAFSLNTFSFESDTKTLQSFIQDDGMTPKILKTTDIHLSFSISDNHIQFSGEYNSYIAADIASFARHQLLLKGKSFSFETVFSHESKLEFLEKAKAQGYKIYFYFLATDDPAININRVKIRVAQHGHFVPDEKVVKRYYRSLDLLLDAVRKSKRAYLFDSSGVGYELIAEITDGKKVKMEVKSEKVPNWFIDNLYRKQEGHMRC